MKIHNNEKLYQRNERLALIANLGGLIALVAAVFVLFNSPGQLGSYFLFLFGGIALVQAGLYFGRLGKRADLMMNKALKSLDNKFSIYHHTSPIQHLLVGPTGAWIIIPRHTKGKVHFNLEKQRWELRGSNIFSRFWRRLSQEKLGRPHFEAMIEAGTLDRLLQKEWTSDEAVPVHAVAVFLDEDVTLDAGDAPFPAVQLKKLKQVVSKSVDKQKLNNTELKQLNSILQNK